MKLREYREEQIPELTQGQLANVLGVTGSVISRYETEDTVPSTKILAKLMTLTKGKVTLQDFVTCP